MINLKYKVDITVDTNKLSKYFDNYKSAHSYFVNACEITSSRVVELFVKGTENQWFLLEKASFGSSILFQCFY